LGLVLLVVVVGMIVVFQVLQGLGWEVLVLLVVFVGVIVVFQVLQELGW
jgi:hypothetical protein